jgi:hypothetical protein
MDSQLICEIKANWEPSSGKAGILVQRFDGFWHYGVALSKNKVISWGPCEKGNPYCKGQLTVHGLEQSFKDAIHVPYLKQADILQNLITSVPAFHHQWLYGFQGWNCEHWARLVVSGQPISYQVKEQGFGIFDVFGVLHVRGEAIETLNKYKRIPIELD